ncbi:MAG: CpsB/CapC family capsule biosynthesis tyrosine phosphatase [Tissierellales bacterium]
MIDLHCHILPGVDDGANSLEEAVAMARMAKNNGIFTMFATPHYIEGMGYEDANSVWIILEKLNSELEDRGIDVKIFQGREVYSSPDVLKLLDEGKISTLNKSKYMLIELPMHDIPMYIDTMIYNLRLKGIIPIIAHPERNTKIIEDPNILYNFISKGVLAQLNLPSLLGRYGKRVKRTAEILLKHDMIHFIGTDAHRPSERYYAVNEALIIMNDLIGEEKTSKIVENNSEKIISGNHIDIDEPKLYELERGIKKFFNSLLKK